MKCPICGGKGFVYNALGGFNEDCGICDGTGEIYIPPQEQEPLTNDEWRKTCSTEEFAKWIYDLIMHEGNTEWYEDLLDYREDTMNYRADYHLIEKWLKEKHEC